MRHHGSQTHIDAHPQTGGPDSVPSYTAHNVGSHTAWEAVGGHIYARRRGRHGPDQPHRHVPGCEGGLPQHHAPPPAGCLETHGTPLPGLPTSVPRHPHVCSKSRCGHHPMGPPREWSPARGCGRPIPPPTHHPPAGVLHPTHIPGRGTIPPTDRTPGICGRHGGGDRHRPSIPVNYPGPHQATKVLHAVTNYLEGKQLLVHNVKSATMVHNAPPPPLRSGDPAMNPVSAATYLGSNKRPPPTGSPYHRT